MTIINVLCLVLFLFITKSVTLFEGDKCVVIHVNNSLEAGKCINIEKCNVARQLLNKGRTPQTCGFNKNSPLVCCPVTLEERLPLFESKAEEKCLEYHNRRLIVTDIARGRKALRREFPHMAAVGYGDDKNKISWLCGGSLISESFVLTAAHCAVSSDFGPPKWVRLGDLDLSNTTDDTNIQDITISKIHLHPNYSSPSHYHDIALIKLTHTARFNLYVRPACLQTKRTLSTEKLQVIGWGKTNFIGTSSSHLLKATLNVVTHENCVQNYVNIAKRRLRNGIVEESQICAGSSSGEDTCPGDSGGPLHYLSTRNRETVDHFVVVGVTSFGKACGIGTTVGVYTRVSFYTAWIESIVWPSTK